MKKILDEKGLTLTELLMAAGIMALMVMFIGKFLLDSYSSNLYLQSTTDLGNYSQQTVNQIRLDLSQSKRILDNSEHGLGYWRSAFFPEKFQPIEGSTLPEIVPQGSLSPSNVDDFKNPYVPESVGNALFYAEHRPALEDKDSGRIIDLYRFVSYFLHESHEARFSNQRPYFLDLMRCESKPYADYYQMYHIKEENIRRSLLNMLEQSNVVALWDYQASAEVAFTPLQNFEPGDFPLNQHLIQMDHCRSVIPQLGRADRPAGSLTYSVAFNKTDSFPIKLPVPLYAKARLETPSFPHGLEIMIVGPKNGRQVLIRLVLAANITTQIVSRESSVIASVKDS